MDKHNREKPDAQIGSYALLIDTANQPIASSGMNIGDGSGL